jgi:2-enoate reductase
MTQFKLSEICDNVATVSTPSGKKEELQADTLVLAIGLEADRQLYRAVAGSSADLFLIGDAREARNIMGAIWDAYEVGRSI